MRRDNWRASRDPHGKTSWTAYKIIGSNMHQHNGVIYASTKLEAEQQAYAVFKAHTPREMALIYVREAEPQPALSLPSIGSSEATTRQSVR